MSIQALREQRDATAKELRELVNKKNWNAATDQPVYDAGMSKIEAIDQQIGNITKLNEQAADNYLAANLGDAHARQLHNAGEAATARSVYAKWLRAGERGLAEADIPLFRNTMSTTTQTEGGYTVATEVAATVVEALKKFGGMRQVADVIVTSGGNPMQFPTSDYTSEEGEIVGENVTASVLDSNFGTKALPVYKYSSKSFAVPIELLQDSNVDIEAWVQRVLVSRLGRITNKHYTTGTGASQPQGMIPAVSIGITAANSTSQVTAVKYDSLVDLQHSVDPEYREMGNCGFMFNDTTLRQIRKVVDGQSRPIFVPGYEVGAPGGAPATLLGSPITINQAMADMAANALSIAYGDMSFYKIRDALDVMIARYTDSAFGLKGQVGFCGWLRSGGNFVDVGGAVKTFRNAAS